MQNSTDNRNTKKLLKNKYGRNDFKSQNNIDYCRNKMNEICRSLSKSTNLYRPEVTVRFICDYLSEKNKLQRILYSEISNYIFSLDSEKRGIFATNIDSLLQHVLSNNFCCERADKKDCQKIVIKIYDHFQLAVNQIENSKNILASGVEELKESIQKENKGIEREYITILAIFSSIVVTFIGGVSFSNDVLKHMHSVSIYRLLITINGLAFVLLNLIYMLVYLIFEINDKKIANFSIGKINAGLACIAFMIIVSWIFNLHRFSIYYRNIFLPW